MTPEQHTPWTAADPRTPAADLAEIAARRPDLRPAVATNPSAYPALLQWLAALGDPAVDAALRARNAPPGQGHPGAAPPRSSRTVLWVVLAVVVLLVGLGVAATAYFVSVVRTGLEEGFPGVTGPPGLGQDDESLLEELYQACADGDGVACDELYYVAPEGSDYEEFADTCGGRAEAGTLCAGEPLGDQTYGSDPELDALWDACEAGDDSACSTLYVESPYRSEYEQFGSTCGGREPEGSCR